MDEEKKEISEEINPLSQQEQWLREREQQLAQFVGDFGEVGTQVVGQQLAHREAELKKKEERLEQMTGKERVYDSFRKVPVRYLDYLIAACAVGIVVCVVLGMLKGRGMI